MATIKSGKEYGAADDALASSEDNTAKKQSSAAHRRTHSLSDSVGEKKPSPTRLNSFPPPSGKELPPSTPLGFGLVAEVRRLEYKERSQRRLMGGKQSSLRRLLSPSPVEHKTDAGETSPLVSQKEEDQVPLKEETAQELAQKETTLEALWDMIFGAWVSLLLVFAPFALASHFLQWSPQYTFWLCFLTMIPLASILGDFTEEAAAHTNEVIGGLVRTTVLVCQQLL